jgi:hypothetical protein
MTKQSYFIHNFINRHISFTILRIVIFHSYSYKYSYGSDNEGGEGCHLRWRPVAASRRGHTREIETEGGRIEVDNNGMLRVWNKAVMHSEAGVEAVACSEAEDKAAVCSGAEIEDGRRWRHHGLGRQKSESTWQF